MTGATTEMKEMKSLADRKLHQIYWGEIIVEIDEIYQCTDRSGDSSYIPCHKPPYHWPG